MLINAAPTIEHLKDGRQRNINTKKIIHQHVSCIYEIYKPNGEVLLTYFDNYHLITKKQDS
jgi:hypothetical protein